MELVDKFIHEHDNPIETLKTIAGFPKLDFGRVIKYYVKKNKPEIFKYVLNSYSLRDDIILGNDWTCHFSDADIYGIVNLEIAKIIIRANFLPYCSKYNSVLEIIFLSSIENSKMDIFDYIIENYPKDTLIEYLENDILLSKRRRDNLEIFQKLFTKYPDFFTDFKNYSIRTTNIGVINLFRFYGLAYKINLNSIYPDFELGLDIKHEMKLDEHVANTYLSNSENYNNSAWLFLFSICNTEHCNIKNIKKICCGNISKDVLEKSIPYLREKFVGVELEQLMTIYNFYSLQ